MEYKDWLKSLQPGDRVVIETTNGCYFLRKVARLTKTQIVIDNFHKFYLSGGHLVGGSLSHNRTRIVPFTKEKNERIERMRLINSIKKSYLSDISIESLRQILSIIESETRP